MKRVMIGLILLLLNQTSSANPGLLFNVVADGTTLIFTPKANHAYPMIGLLIKSTSYHFNQPNLECVNWPNTGNYCYFPASPTVPGRVSISGLDGEMDFELCLNPWGKLTCQNYRVHIGQNNCLGVNGKIVSGSNACWIQVSIPSVPLIFRCSSACAQVGLTLEQPGPTNNATLAGNVCAAFGFTDVPIQLPSASNATIISNDTSDAGPTSCLWNNVTSTDWDNPADQNIGGVIGSYFCPCG